MSGSVELNLHQVRQIEEFIGDDPETVVTVCHSETGHSGPGLYVWCTDVPDEGAMFLD